MANDERTLTQSFIGASPFLVKVLELIISLLCLVLIYVPFDNHLQYNLHHVGIVYVSYCSSVIINTVLIVTHLKGDRVPKRTLFIFSAVLGILFLVTGFVVLSDYWISTKSIYFHLPKKILDMMMFSGVFALLNSIIFFIDIWLTYQFD